MARNTYLALFVVLVAMGVNHTHAQTTEEELALAYGDKSFVSIATGTRQPIARAPAVATVITAGDIEAIGARDLDEVLETVPGVHVARSTSSFNPIYVIRGIHTQFNPQVLMLINGVPITSVFVGDRSQAWGGMPVENIARIEIIRGPGSALYGADAFAGVINIITKSAKDIAESEVGARAGSFSTWDVWSQNKGMWGDANVAFYVRAGATDGHDETVTADAQSFFDSLFGTQASLAPGSINTGSKGADMHFDFDLAKWRWQTNYQGRRDVETGTGIASALDPTGRSESDRFLSSLTYSDPNFARDWDLKAELSYFYLSDRHELVLFPAGANFTPLGGGPFPDGVIGNPSKWEKHWRAGVSTLFTGLDNHKVRLGAGWMQDDMYKVRESKNFAQTTSPFPTPLPGGVTDVSDTAPFLRPHKREIWYGYVQDEWGFARDWALTAGLRHDDYSDFGGTTNPRLAVVWDAAYNMTAKLLYGRAFRAPSFVELYNINNPVLIGNPDLKPETIDTVEFALTWQPHSRLQTGFNVFRYEMEDVIQLVTDPGGTKTAQNAGRQTGDGFEIEATWDANESTRIVGNYAHQQSVNEITGEDAGNAPHNQAYVRIDWRFMSPWTLNVQAKWVADRKRQRNLGGNDNDLRSEIPDYTIVDAGLHYGRSRDKWSVTFSIKNLFDEDAREPSPAPGLIPDDFPLPGRWYLLQARYQL